MGGHTRGEGDGRVFHRQARRRGQVLVSGLISRASGRHAEGRDQRSHFHKSLRQTEATAVGTAGRLHGHQMEGARLPSVPVRQSILALPCNLWCGANSTLGKSTGEFPGSSLRAPGLLPQTLGAQAGLDAAAGPVSRWKVSRCFLLSFPGLVPRPGGLETSRYGR